MIGLALGLIANLGLMNDGLPIDGEGAIEIARSYAVTQGVKERMDLFTVTQERPNELGELHYVRFGLPDHREVRCFLKPDGKISRFFVLTPDTPLPTSKSQSTVDRFKQLLSSFDVPGPYRLQMLSEFDDPAKAGNPYIEIADRDRVVYCCTLPAGANPRLTISRKPEGDTFIGFHQAALKIENLEKIAKSWRERFNKKEEVELDSFVEGDKHIGLAQFGIRRKGFPFVARWQDYGYTISMTVPEGKLVCFSAREDVPEVGPHSPLITASDAVKAAKETLDTDLVPKAWSERHWKMTYELGKTPSLGWFLPIGQTVARLVWCLPYTVAVDRGLSRIRGSDVIWIDTQTGKYLHA